MDADPTKLIRCWLWKVGYRLMKMFSTALKVYSEIESSSIGRTSREKKEVFETISNSGDGLQLYFITSKLVKGFKHVTLRSSKRSDCKRSFRCIFKNDKECSSTVEELTLRVSLTHVGGLLQINFGKDIIYERNQPVTFQPASEFLPMIDEVYKALIEKTKSIPGSMVENNRFCVSVHFRCVDEKNWTILAEQVRSVLKEYPKLRLSQGRKVLEIRPRIKWDKGKALEFLLESLGFANQNNVLPIYIGDDRTDEDAFKVVPHIIDASNFSVAPGEKIFFKNNAGFPHNIVFDEDEIPAGVDAGKISMGEDDYLKGPGEKYKVSLDAKGTYNFFCATHQGAGMVGKVTVN